MAKASMHGMSEKEGKAWGRGEHANMPKDVSMKMYPKANEFGAGVIDDTMTEIDQTTRSAHSKARKNLSNQH